MYFVTKDEYARRISICKRCELYSHFLCTDCDCAVHLKCKLAFVSCPIDKWKSVDESTFEDTIGDSDDSSIFTAD
jgi:hypothetical protein